MFFERITNQLEEGSDRNEIRSILRNLNNMLNTKKGFGSVLEGYGIRDLNEYSSREQLTEAVVEEVRQNIELYEPRVELKEIVVEDAADPFRIAFRIECRVKETRESLLMEFNSVHKNMNVSNS